MEPEEEEEKDEDCISLRTSSCRLQHDQLDPSDERAEPKKEGECVVVGRLSDANESQEIPTMGHGQYEDREGDGDQRHHKEDQQTDEPGVEEAATRPGVRGVAQSGTLTSIPRGCSVRCVALRTPFLGL